MQLSGVKGDSVVWDPWERSETPNYVLCFSSKSLLYLLEATLTRFPHLYPLGRGYGLDSHPESATDRPVVGYTHLVPSVLQLLDPTRSSIEDSITPCRGPPFLARVVVVRSDIVLVRRSEGDRTLGEGSESEAWVPLPRQKELIPFQEFAQIVRLHCADDGISRHGVDAIVEISVEHTYLVVQDQGAIAPADIHVSSKRWIPLSRQGSRLQDCGNISVTVHRLGLPGSQVAVDETDGTVIKHEA